ncbi:hypothetical protein KR093_008072 [Drosophila rubida]|uniref:RING-type E3 ubiquitin transferase n=1 Tax=Drosophila rubida TaxID=30044 RepID=A0AAD4KAU6_9MUSC|nr:hypothetical protein KR093_008072 [Drosophila rubida]
MNTVDSVVSPPQNGIAIASSSSSSLSTSNSAYSPPITDPLPAIVGQINEQRRLFLKSTINEVQEEEDRSTPEAQNETETATEAEPQLRRQQPPSSLALHVKYATLPSPSTITAVGLLRSPLSPPPKPPMLSRTRSTGSGDGRTPLANGDTLLLRHSVAEATTTTGVTTATTAGTAAAISETTAVGTAEVGTVAVGTVAVGTAVTETVTEGTVAVGSAAVGTATMGTATTTPPKTLTTPPSMEQLPPSPPASISGKHYESLIEELRCPGCAGPMKAPVLLCKSGHSICEQCTRILLMCPLCKEGFSTMRSLTTEALCAKAHFGCSHSAGGCTVRMPVALLPWHEQQCIYKPMKCFMGRVWGDCRWHGREVQWKQHLEEQHMDKVFRASTADLVWNMGMRRKPLTGYYVFQAHDEMFNFYEIYDKQRILFTMTCTSNRRESKYNYAYEVTLLQTDNEAVSLTQKFPVHSEYDRDILMEGTCVSIGLNELARFVDDDSLLHYRVSVMAVKSPRRLKPARQSLPAGVDYHTRSNGVNGKSVPANMIITRTYKEALGEVSAASAPATPTTPDGDDENGGAVADLERKWGTPQLHFNRKYLRNTLNAEGNASGSEGKDDELRPLQETRSMAGANEDKLSLCSNSTSYTKKFSNSLRRSFRSLKTDLIELRPFSKKKTSVLATSPATKTQQ